jgi:uncharacterized protein
MTNVLPRRRAVPSAALLRVVALVTTLLSIGAPRAKAQRDAIVGLERPAPRDFLCDHARLVDAADAGRIRDVCNRLLSDTATPIVVVTIDSMAEHGGEGLRIETFATLLYDQWQVGQEKLDGRDWNLGVLLLVSRSDRRARIELGAGFGRRQDAECRRIMDEEIVPRFKQGDDSSGILAGVESLDRMVRRFVGHDDRSTSTQAPGSSRPMPADDATSWRPILVTAGLTALLLFTIVSFVRRGESGWAWLFWGVVLSAVGTILLTMLTRGRRWSGSGGGFGGSFGGGSFGGGFSGGGGASGSW